MYMKIPLRLHGLDLRQIDVFERITPELAELFWCADGEMSLAIVLIDAPVEPEEAIEAAIVWAHRIAELIPGVWVSEATYEIRDAAEDGTLHLTSPQLDTLNVRIRELSSLLKPENE